VQVARRSDVDMNQHLNNVTYLAWCLETVPLDVYTNCQLHQARTTFCSWDCSWDPEHRARIIPPC